MWVGPEVLTLRPYVTARDLTCVRFRGRRHPSGMSGQGPRKPPYRGKPASLLRGSRECTLVLCRWARALLWDVGPGAGAARFRSPHHVEGIQSLVISGIIIPYSYY